MEFLRIDISSGKNQMGMAQNEKSMKIYFIILKIYSLLSCFLTFVLSWLFFLPAFFLVATLSVFP